MIEFPSTTVVNRILPKDKFVEHLDLTTNLKKKLISDIVHIKILNKFSKSVLGFRDFKDPFWHSVPLPPAKLGADLNEVPSECVSIVGAAATDGGVQASDRMSASRRAGEQSETEGVLKESNKPIEKPIKEVLLLQIELKKHDFDSKLIETIAKQNSHKLVFLLRFDKYSKLAVYYKQLYIGKWKPFEELSLVLKGNSVNEVWLSFVEQIALDESNAISKSDLDHKLELQNKAKALEKEIAKLDTAIRKERQPNRKFELHKKMMELEKSLKALRFRV